MPDNVKVVRGAYEAFAKGDVAGVLGVLDGKVEWSEAEHMMYWPGGPFVGPQAALEGVFARTPKGTSTASGWTSSASSAAATPFSWKLVTARR